MKKDIKQTRRTGDRFDNDLREDLATRPDLEERWVDLAARYCPHCKTDGWPSNDQEGKLWHFTLDILCSAADIWYIRSDTKTTERLNGAYKTGVTPLVKGEKHMELCTCEKCTGVNRLKEPAVRVEDIKALRENLRTTRAALTSFLRLVDEKEWAGCDPLVYQQAEAALAVTVAGI